MNRRENAITLAVFLLFLLACGLTYQSIGGYTPTPLVAWDEVSIADGYRIYIDGEMVAEVPVAEVAVQRYTDAAGRTIEFCVSAYNFHGESGQSCIDVDMPPLGIFR